MSTPKLYHRDIFLPEEFVKSFVGHSYHLGYTRHAQHAACDEGFVMARPPSRIRIDNASQIIEVERCNGETTKLVVRIPYSATDDLVFVLRNLDDGAATVITLWKNAINDKHTTLKKEPYATSS